MPCTKEKGLFLEEAICGAQLRCRLGTGKRIHTPQELLRIPGLYLHCRGEYAKDIQGNDLLEKDLLSTGYDYIKCPGASCMK